MYIGYILCICVFFLKGHRKSLLCLHFCIAVSLVFEQINDDDDDDEIRGLRLISKAEIWIY